MCAYNTFLFYYANAIVFNLNVGPFECYVIRKIVSFFLYNRCTYNMFMLYRGSLTLCKPTKHTKSDDAYYQEMEVSTKRVKIGVLFIINRLG